MIDGKEVKEICPHFTDSVIGASWCPTDGHANPMKTTLAFYKRGRELGVHYISQVILSLRCKKVSGKSA